MASARCSSSARLAGRGRLESIGCCIAPGRAQTALRERCCCYPRQGQAAVRTDDALRSDRYSNMAVEEGCLCWPRISHRGSGRTKHLRAQFKASGSQSVHGARCCCLRALYVVSATRTLCDAPRGPRTTKAQAPARAYSTSAHSVESDARTRSLTHPRPHRYAVCPFTVCKRAAWKRSKSCLEVFLHVCLATQ